MSLKQPTEKSILKNPLIKLANVFGITPFYDFKTRKLTYKRVFRLYGLLLAVSSTTGTVLFYNYSQNEMVSISSFLTYVHALMVVTCLSLFLIVTLGSSFWHMQLWEQMLNLLSQVEYHVRCTRKYFISIPFLFLIIGTLHGIIIFTYIVHFMETSFTELFLPVIVLQYVILVLVCLVLDIVGFLRNIYKSINSTLTDINVCVVIKSNAIDKLQEVGKVYKKAGKIVDLFNKVFGWPLLLLLAQSVECVLLSLAFLTERSRKFQMYNVVPSEVLVLNTLYAIMGMCEAALIIFECDAAVREENKLFKKCYKLYQNLPISSREKEQLEELQNLIQNKNPRFTAANFFELKRSTLLSLVGTTTTYMIVMLQFQFL